MSANHVEVHKILNDIKERRIDEAVEKLVDLNLNSLSISELRNSTSELRQIYLVLMIMVLA